jgi:O-antigen/teichoic acid export membrane protein
MLRHSDKIITVLTVLIPLTFQVYYIHYVSNNISQLDYGNFIIISSFIIALSQILLSIPQQAFSRFYNNSKYIDIVNEFRTYLIFINIISVLFIYLFYLFYANRFSTEVYILMCLFFIFSSNYSLNQNIFLLNLERKKYFFLKIMEGVAKFILPLVLYSYFETLESFFSALVLGYFLSLLIILMYLKSYIFKFSYSFNNSKKYFFYAYPIIFTSLSSWIISFSDRYFIDYYVDTENVGIYSLLSQLASFAQIAGVIFAIYVNPIVLAAYEKNKTLGLKTLKIYLKQLVYSLIVMYIIFLFLPKNLYINLINENMITNDYYFYTFTILILAVFLTVLQTALSMYFVLFKKLNILALFFVFVAIINIIANFLIMKYGIIAAAVSTLISYFILNVLIINWLRLKGVKLKL